MLVIMGSNQSTASRIREWILEIKIIKELEKKKKRSLVFISTPPYSIYITRVCQCYREALSNVRLCFPFRICVIGFDDDNDDDEKKKETASATTQNTK